MPTFLTSDGLELFYKDEGQGIPILCLAGLTRDHRDFDFVAPHLADHRVIMMDYRGRGQSDWAEDFTTYSVPREAQDALELLDHLGLTKAAIIGTSRGGLIAMYLALTAKDRLLGVALNDVGPVLEQSALDEIMVYLGRKPVAKTHEEAAAALEHVSKGFANVPHSRWMETAKTLFNATADGLDLTYDPKLRDAVASTFTSPVPEAWPLFDAMEGLPIALIHAANSDLLTRESALRMKERRPDMVLTHVPDRGHIPYLDEPESLAALREWIGML